jgi:cyclophilin family peptidyl-prolyl cis-trans isomerase
MKHAGLAAGVWSFFFGMTFAGAAWAQEGAGASPAISPASSTASSTTPAEATKWAGPEVRLNTSMGEIVITLDMVGAPRTAANFLRHVKAGHFNGAAFYRIEPGFLIQLGDLNAAGKYRRPQFPPIPLETATNKHAKYSLGLAHGDDPNSGQSTFYIDLADNPGLNAKPDAPPNTTGFAAFGHVTSGFEVVDRIAAVELAPKGGPFPGKLPKVPVVVKSAVVTKAN